MRIAKALLFITFAAVGGGASSGCNPSDFNSASDKAPVLSFSASGSSTGSLFVLPLTPPDPSTGIAARMLFSREDSMYLAVADYDTAGKVTLHEPSTDEYYSLGEVAVTSMAERADGTLLLGMPGYGGGTSPAGRVSTLTLTTQANGSVGFGIQPSIQGGATGVARLGISVAAGNLSGVIGDAYSVAVSDTSVQVVSADGMRSASSDPTTCQQYLNLANAYAFRPVVVANLFGTDIADTSDEIVLSGYISGIGGVVVSLTYANGPNSLKCQKIFSQSLPTFGASLAAGDFDGDGHMDLAVGSPPDTVYVYFGPLDKVTDSLAADVTIYSSTGKAFGQRLATYQLLGQPMAQLLVADPTASVGQGGKVGKVMLFNITRGIPTMSTTDALATLFDSNGGSNFGAVSLGGLPFNTCTGATQLVPWVSTSTEILTFFNYLSNYSNPPSPVGDPRCFK
jgi:hypothetical protein